MTDHHHQLDAIKSAFKATGISVAMLACLWFAGVCINTYNEAVTAYAQIERGIQYAHEVEHGNH